MSSEEKMAGLTDTLAGALSSQAAVVFILLSHSKTRFVRERQVSCSKRIGNDRYHADFFSALQLILVFVCLARRRKER